MDLKFFLMRKDELLGYFLLSEEGNILGYSLNKANEDLLPIQNRWEEKGIKKWWADRAVPLQQGRIKDYLRENGYSIPSQYLIKNLALSLTDYYWIKPVDSDITWRNVNLFENDFKENLLYLDDEKSDLENHNIGHYSPNGSLQGDIEKTWAIFDGERWLIKGNRNNYSSESINEVIASDVHKNQNWNNYVPYQLLSISKKDYDYGCRCRSFTSNSVEFVPAYAIYTSIKKCNSDSPYQHYLKACKNFGADIEQLQFDMDYQIMTDFILSGYDRHLNNFGFLRESESLRFIRTAPIFDSGGCLFVNKAKPFNTKDLYNIKTNSLCSRERNMLNLVRDRSCIDLTKLPSASSVRSLYMMDSQIDERTVNLIVRAYEKKIDMCRQFQLGKDIYKVFYTISRK